MPPRQTVRITKPKAYCWECSVHLLKKSWRRHWKAKHGRPDAPPLDVGSNFKGKVKVKGGVKMTKEAFEEQEAYYEALDDAQVVRKVTKFSSSPPKRSPKSRTNPALPSPGIFNPTGPSPSPKLT